MRWHSQKLNERRDGTCGSIFRHGRGWLWFGERANLRAEWNFFGSRRLGLNFSSGGEDDFGFSLHLWWASIYLTLSDALAYNSFLDRNWPRETGITLSKEEWFLTVDLACQSDQWPPKKGWSKSWFLKDVLLGRTKFTRIPIEKREMAVAMPEGAYPCTVQMERREWKRPRWPITKRVLAADVEVPGGIPHPGKGTCAHNCGDDATYSLSCPARDVHEAVSKFSESVMRDRERYPL